MKGNPSSLIESLTSPDLSSKYLKIPPSPKAAFAVPTASLPAPFTTDFPTFFATLPAVFPVIEAASPFVTFFPPTSPFPKLTEPLAISPKLNSANISSASESVRSS